MFHSTRRTMSTKTAAKKSPSKRKPKSVSFMSRFPDLTMIRIPVEHIYGQRGEIRGITSPEPDESPWSVQFIDSYFETDDETIIEFIREHELFNTDVWEAGAAPDEPQPTYSDQMKAISVAAATRNIPELEAVIKEEKKTHNRPPILQAADAAIEAIEAVPTELGGTDDDRQVIESISPSSEQD
jgi:hypothetical protein